jgi:hypothetical protein
MDDRDTLARTQAYRAAQVASHALLEQVRNWLDGHQACSITEETTWGHVADVQRIQQGLEDILSAMRTR